MSSGLQVVTDFVTVARRFVLINSDHEPVLARWAGLPIHIPGREEISKPQPHNLTAFVSATDRDRSYIPGTLVLADRYGTDADGGEIISFDSGQAVRFILGVNTRNGLATSAFARRGLSLLPKGSNRAKLEEIREMGYRRSETWRVQQARTLINDIDSANIKREKHRIPPLPGGEDYVRAVMELRAYHEKEQELVRSILHPGEKFEALDVAEARGENENLLAFLKEKMNEAATPDVTTDEKQKLIEKMIQDPATLKLLEVRMNQDYKMVKRLRRQPPPRAKMAPKMAAQEPPKQEEEATPPQQTDLFPEEIGQEVPLDEVASFGVGIPPGEPTPADAHVGSGGGDLPDWVKEKFNDPEPPPAEGGDGSTDL